MGFRFFLVYIRLLSIYKPFCFDLLSGSVFLFAFHCIEMRSIAFVFPDNMKCK